MTIKELVKIRKLTRSDDEEMQNLGILLFRSKVSLPYVDKHEEIRDLIIYSVLISTISDKEILNKINHESSPGKNQKHDK